MQNFICIFQIFVVPLQPKKIQNHEKILHFLFDSSSLRRL